MYNLLLQYNLSLYKLEAGETTLDISILSLPPDWPEGIGLGDPEVTANLYCNFAYPYWEVSVICSIFSVTSGSPSTPIVKYHHTYDKHVRCYPKF